MRPEEYQSLAQRTECDQSKALDRMDNGVDGFLPIRLNHSIIGLTGEVGELASQFQKMVYYGKPLTKEMKANFLEEFGDAMWYIAEGLNALGADMGQVMEANIAKLRSRYPDRYSDLRAAEENRDREAEAKAIDAKIRETTQSNLLQQERARRKKFLDRSKEVIEKTLPSLPSELVERIVEGIQLLPAQRDLLDDLLKERYDTPPRRIRSQVLRQRATVIGCCNDHADMKPCRCLEDALPDPIPDKTNIFGTHVEPLGSEEPRTRIVQDGHGFGHVEFIETLHNDEE